MAAESSDRTVMRDQILSQPTLLRDIVEPATRQVADALRDVQPQRWQAVYTAGCGDSFYAGLACEMAFARFCRLPVKALAAMPFARYEAAQAPLPAGLFGISNSGEVARSIEAVALARAAGMDTVAVTGREDSGIAREAAAAIAVPIASMGRAPGIRSYTVQLVSLLLCAIQVGELRQVLTGAEADGWRRRLVEVADCMAATIAVADAPAREAAERFGSGEDWVFLGSGPNYATALFIAAKLVESCGANAWGQDVEEWGHIQFFNAQQRTPTCLIVPPGRSLRAGFGVAPSRQGRRAPNPGSCARRSSRLFRWMSSCRCRKRCRNCSRRWFIACLENSSLIILLKSGNPAFSSRPAASAAPAAGCAKTASCAASTSFHPNDLTRPYGVFVPWNPTLAVPLSFPCERVGRITLR